VVVEVAVVMVMALDDHHDGDCVIMGQSGWVVGWVGGFIEYQWILVLGAGWGAGPVFLWFRARSSKFMV
jgi:hypothetical protein